MPVKEADPAAKSLDAAFAEAMGAPPRPREPAAPPEIDPEAPHGRDEQGEPLEPFGRTKDGKIRRSRAGRPSKDDKPRTGPAQAGSPAGTIALIKQDYSEGLADTADAAWFGLSALGMAGGKIPVIGRFIPEEKLGAQAAVFHAEQDRLVQCVNIAAQHNPRARRFAERCADGTVSWVLMCGFLAMPFLTVSVAVWQGDKALKERELPSLAELAKKNEADLDRFMASMADQLQAAADLEPAGQEAA